MLDPFAVVYNNEYGDEDTKEEDFDLQREQGNPWQDRGVDDGAGEEDDYAPYPESHGRLSRRIEQFDFYGNLPPYPYTYEPEPVVLRFRPRLPPECFPPRVYFYGHLRHGSSSLRREWVPGDSGSVTPLDEGSGVGSDGCMGSLDDPENYSWIWRDDDRDITGSGAGGR